MMASIDQKKHPEQRTTAQDKAKPNIAGIIQRKFRENLPIDQM